MLSGSLRDYWEQDAERSRPMWGTYEGRKRAFVASILGIARGGMLG